MLFTLCVDLKVRSRAVSLPAHRFSLLLNLPAKLVVIYLSYLCFIDRASLIQLCCLIEYRFPYRRFLDYRGSWAQRLVVPTELNHLGVTAIHPWVGGFRHLGDLLVLEHACLNILPIIGHISQPAWGEQICHRLLVLILTHGTRSPPIIFRCGHGGVTSAIR